MTGEAPILVAVAGNEVAGGDALGPLVARRLGERRPAGVEVLDLGMNPSRLIDCLAGRRMLVLADAIAGPRADCGKIVCCRWEDCSPGLLQHLAISSHGLSVADQLLLADRLGLLPDEIWFVGMIQSSFDPGPPGAAVIDHASKVAEVVTDLIRRFTTPEPSHA